jgi:hypothetical protein
MPRFDAGYQRLALGVEHVQGEAFAEEQVADLRRKFEHDLIDIVGAVNLVREFLQLPRKIEPILHLL